MSGSPPASLGLPGSTTATGVCTCSRALAPGDAYFLKDELPDAQGSKGQFVLEPTLRVMKGPIRARAGYILPIGGRLHHGETNVSGLRLGVGSVF